PRKETSALEQLCPQIPQTGSPPSLPKLLVAGLEDPSGSRPPSLTPSISYPPCPKHEAVRGLLGCRPCCRLWCCAAASSSWPCRLQGTVGRAAPSSRRTRRPSLRSVIKDSMRMGVVKDIFNKPLLRLLLRQQRITKLKGSNNLSNKWFLHIVTKTQKISIVYYGWSH
ncbi:hypothetical protein BRADI_4g24216v3, partial [Brachypodium distachyon]